MDKGYNNDNSEVPLMPLLSLVLCRTLVIAEREQHQKDECSNKKKTANRGHYANNSK